MYVGDILFWNYHKIKIEEKMKVGVAAILKNNSVALAGVAQRTECQPVNERVTGSILSLGHMPGVW